MPNDWVNVEVKGLDDLQAKLEALPEKLAAKSLRSALRDAAALMVSAFVAFAPRRTGFLAQHFGMNIHIRKEDLAGAVVIGPLGHVDYPDADGGYTLKKKKNGKARKVGRIAVASVARYLEFGTKNIEKRPFMTPAWESHKQVALDVIVKNLQDGLESES